MRFKLAGRVFTSLLFLSALFFLAGVLAAQVRPRAPFDFDGDNKTDHSIYRPSNGEWWILKSATGENNVFRFGLSSDRIVPADYTGDGKTDIAVWRPSTGEWFIMRSEDYSYYSYPLGLSTDIPQVGDFDGDGKADTAVFRPSTGVWYILRSSDLGYTIQQFGTNGDVPAAADYDGDGKTDVAIHRPSNAQWWINHSSAGLVIYTLFSAPTGIIPADYSGDGKADPGYFFNRSSSSLWYYIANGTYYRIEFGNASDKPVPGDYDGDGRIDFAVYRPLDGSWRIRLSTSGATSVHYYGIPTDIPIPMAFFQ